MEREKPNETPRACCGHAGKRKKPGEQGKPVCQSPGFPTVYVSFGDNSLPGQDLKKIWAEELVRGTKNQLLRPSMVHPLTRVNPGDNSGTGVPNFEFDYNPGQEYLEMIVSFKGCGAELANAMQIFTVAKLEKDKNYAGLKRWVLDTVIKGGGKPCPRRPSASAWAGRWTWPASWPGRRSASGVGTT